ncbi:cold shock domain-containing protein [Escherichia coli]|uniref:cold shock domain-containing protein n=1 Tax=unclassified Escherichia TaxID=2608889 RepID=UPI000CF6AEBF|nr:MULTISPECIES: cold shock domain-containing protein [unclassified Escherichia]EHR8245087.1 cold shock domain-containing protein [Escherichia coli]EKK3233965.1 cold shock domain-containing protein [Escherichia coli]MBB2417189.1 cold shock domain-containing protein [Escherichia sp. 11.1596]MBB2420786.1 cold shock domain-containing protein [Escherichia sp. 12.2610]MBB2425576.1 cold shock domain-containing protein [Escherichia sp. 11.1597]
MSYKMAGIVKSYNILSVKGLIIPPDSRKDDLLHISAVNPRQSELLIPGSSIEFCRINGNRGPVAANIYLF